MAARSSWRASSSEKPKRLSPMRAGSPVQSGPKVAGLGEHTKSVLKEAGLGEAEIKALVK